MNPLGLGYVFQTGIKLVIWTAQAFVDVENLSFDDAVCILDQIAGEEIEKKG